MTAEANGRSGAAMPGVSPHRIADPVMIQRWLRLTFMHWRFDPEVIQAHLPHGLRVEQFDGSAWIGLVAFEMEVGLRRVRPIPWLSKFCETNVRTYVTDGNGHSGVWFFSLDAARLGAVVVARTAFDMPYFWSAMSAAHEPPIVRYQCRRRWPGPRGTTSRAVIEVGAPYGVSEPAPLDHFLTARWALFSVGAGGSRFALAEHRPWPLYRARIVDLHDELITAAGLPLPTGEVLTHYSPGVQVRIGHFQTYDTAKA